MDPRFRAPARDSVLDLWPHWNLQKDARIGGPRAHIGGPLEPYLDWAWKAGSPPKRFCGRW
eukprot:10422883-Lingulodinium_polyedra.AAC.1